LAESHTILWYLADGTPYLPSDPFARAQVLQWMCFEQYSHEPNVAVVRFIVAYAGEHGVPEREIERRRREGYKAPAGMERWLAASNVL
jgi:glutathione S-transferase